MHSLAQAAENSHLYPLRFCIHGFQSHHECLICWQGNRLGGLGLTGICTGLSRNKSLTYISIADNAINNVSGAASSQPPPRLSLRTPCAREGLG
jgi:hypothetical protein